MGDLVFVLVCAVILLGVPAVLGAFKKTPTIVKQYKFEPLDTITAYELAQMQMFFLLESKGYTDAVHKIFDGWPDSVKRHWKVVVSE